MQVIHATWEKENIGAEAWEILLTPEDSLEAVDQAQQEAIAQGADYIVLKTPVNCPQFLFGLPKLGFHFLEMVFHVMIRRESYAMPAAIARFDRGLTVMKRVEESDLERIFALIRAGMFTTDRVSIDPSFGPELGGQRYANWLASMLKKGGDLYEVLSGDTPIGFFVICRKDERTVDPVLMGLYHPDKDRGMGALLHKKTLDTCFEYDCRRLTSTIVSNNAKVLHVYVNAGAEITDTLYTYVKHIPRA